MSDALHVFDRATVRRHRQRAADGMDHFGFLFAEVADRLAERVEDVLRSFPRVLDLGCHGGDLARLLPGRKGIETVICADLAEGMVRRAATASPAARGLVCDEEALPIAAGSVDLVVSALSLHWVNDLPGALLQIRQALRPDGFFLAAMFGGQTLKELRQCFADAEIELEGGISPRTSPFCDMRDAGSLLSRAGFAMPVVDSEIITVSYEHPLKLLHDLRGMGESNAVHERRKAFTRRETLLTAMELYLDRFAGTGDGEEGDEMRVPATFEILWLAGWAPDASQPQPKAPGSATVSLADALRGLGGSCAS